MYVTFGDGFVFIIISHDVALMLPPGFHIRDGVLSSEECDDLLGALEIGSITRGRAGVRNLMAWDVVAGLAADERLSSLAASVHGKDVVPYKAILFEKTGKANWLVAWHQDTALPVEKFIPGLGWSAPSIKAGRLFAQAPAAALSKVLALRIHLDMSTHTNGPLRVIPGSHSFGILNDDKIRELVESADAVECLVGRGGVIAMSPLLLHASSKAISEEPRRVLHIEYSESLDIMDGIQLTLC